VTARKPEEAPEHRRPQAPLLRTRFLKRVQRSWCCKSASTIIYDEQAEYLIRDRLSFHPAFSIGTRDPLPDMPHDLCLFREGGGWRRPD